MDRRDRLAQLLTDDDVATLKHLAREGMGENTLRALASDLAYLEGWSQAATGSSLAVAGDRGADAKIYCASPLGSRPSARAIHGMACRPTSPPGCKQKGCFGAKDRMPQTLSSAVWQAGPRCIGGRASRDRSGRQACVRPYALRCAPPRARVPARANGPSPATCCIDCSRPARPIAWRIRAIWRFSFWLCFRWPPAQRGGAAARRADQRRTIRAARSAGPKFGETAVRVDPARPHQDRQCER